MERGFTPESATPENASPMSSTKDVSRDPPPCGETEYLRRNPDIVAAIGLGKFDSGLEHFQRYGRAEGRHYVVEPDDAIRATFGPVRDFSAPAPEAPRCAIDAVLMSEAGWLFIVGWADDLMDPLYSVRIDGRDWTLEVEARVLGRFARADVQKALGHIGPNPVGIMAVVPAGAPLCPTGECRVRLVWRSREEVSLNVAVRIVSLREMREHVVGQVGANAENGSPIAAMTALESGLGEQIIALNRVVTKGISAAPFIKRFGARRHPPSGSIVVCLFGRPEFMFVQNALFAGKPGIEDYEFIYVCNSPELMDRLLNEAACSTEIYGLAQTVVGLPGNAGFGGANNVGACAARSGRVVCVNPDVFPRNPDWARRHGAIVDAGRDGSRLFGAALYYDDGSLMHGGMFLELDTGAALHPDTMEPCQFARVEHYGKGAPPGSGSLLHPRPVAAVSGAFLSIDRAWFEALGGFSEDYVLGHYEDADLCLRSLSAGTPAWMQDIAMWHLEGHGSTRLQAQAGAALVNRWSFSRRWRERIAAGMRGPSPRLDRMGTQAPAAAIA
jgi:GT2 family glycosyltransferase